MRINIDLPKEFISLCKVDDVKPETVIRGFIADLCQIQSWAANPRNDGYISNGSDERSMARDYYDRVGYPYMKDQAR
jgi:hypothetical protein